MNSYNGYLSADSLSDLEQQLSELARNCETPLYFIPVIGHIDITKVLSRSKHVFLVEKDGFHILDFLPTYCAPDDEGNRVVDEPGGSVYVVPSGFTGVWTLVTDGGNQFIKRLTATIQRERRHVIQYSLTNSDMFNLLEHLDNQLPTNLIAKQTVMRSREGRANTDHKPQLFHKVFDWAEERRDLVSRVRVLCSGSPSLEFMLYRDSSIRLYGGDWGLFCEHVRRPVLENARAKLDLVKGRARKTFEKTGLPLQIRYNEDVFIKRADNLSLVSALQSQGTNSVTVLHANPYLHATVIDLIDGAHIDVFVTSSRTVSVVPGYKANEGSLLRVVHAIQDGLSEGELIDEPQKTEPSLDDIMGVSFS